MIDVGSLTDELLITGLPVVGVSGDGRIDYSRDLTADELLTAQAVIAAHDPVKRERDETTARERAKAAVADLRTYLGLTNPTAAQRNKAIDLLARITIWLLRNEFRT